MRLRAFSKRNLLEMLRDPVSVVMGLGFPIAVLLLLTVIQRSINGDDNPMAELFSLKVLTPGIAVFGLSFISLFSATLISKDRATSYLTRLYASPLTPAEFILGYTLPMLPVAILQSVICFLFAFCLGLTPSWNVLLALAALLPADVLFIALGLICGTVFSDKQVGGVCGALLTNLTAWFSGAWIPLDLIGGAFKKIAEILPFLHAVRLSECAMNGNYDDFTKHLLILGAYTVAAALVSVLAFSKKMKAQ